MCPVRSVTHLSGRSPDLAAIISSVLDGLRRFRFGGNTWGNDWREKR